MITKAYHFFCGCLLCCGAAAALTACEDFFDQESDHVLYDNVNHLDNAVDTVYSMAGIFKKMQALADRTILLGEVRADLVDLTPDASADLRELATFSATSKNVYNQPRDYYAVINNCNYFIANVDTTMKSNRNESVFMKEYAAAKAFRAWTYLQLVLNYGQVPFVIDPILTKEQSELEYPKYTLTDICQFFINDLQNIPQRYNTEYPGYESIHNIDSRYFYFPLSIIRAELYLWWATATNNKEYYRQAALNYYQYISERNGINSAYPTDIALCRWTPGTTTWTSIIYSNFNFYSEENYRSDSEIITKIPGDSIRAQGNYSELRNLFNSNTNNDYKPSITPSQAVEDIFSAQMYCSVATNGQSFVYAPKGLSYHRNGDLRLSYAWEEGYRHDPITGETQETQYIDKYPSNYRNVNVYRRMMVYIRMAEALNHAGYPRMAYAILSTGLDNNIMEYEIMPDYYDQSDSTFLATFDFPISRYRVYDNEDAGKASPVATHNMIGIHSRGSGYTPFNEYYRFPNDTLFLVTDPALRQQLISEQQLYVDSLLLDENALEFCFEGTRYYDLMRFAMHSSNPGKFMASHIYGRRGKANAASVQAEIKTDLTDQRNWYLKWDGKVGF